MTDAAKNSTSPNYAVLVKGSKGFGMHGLIYYFLWLFWTVGKKFVVK
jgi:hypothetical protein